MSYLLLKQIHVGAVITSYALFVLRGVWMMADSQQLQRAWVRTVPHVVDTVLLVAAIWLAFVVRQAPGMDAWLTAKVAGLLLYIALGTIAIKRGSSKAKRIAAWVGAQLVFGYIVLVALTKNPTAGLKPVINTLLGGW